MVARLTGMDSQRLDELVAKFESLVMRVLSRVARAAANLITRGGTPPSVHDLTVIPAQWQRHVETELVPALDAVWRESTKTLATQAASTGREVPPLASQAAEGHLRIAHNRLVGVGDHLWEAAREQLAQGAEAGEGIPELAARVRNTVGVAEARARTIARTQVISANNAASFAQALAIGDDSMTKSWMDSHDDRVRLGHQEADGQSVPLRDAFVVGGEYLMFPGDPHGSPGNVINERCSIGYDLEDLPESVVAAGPLLNQDDTLASENQNTALVAAAEVHTGAMVALIPSEQDGQRLAVDGGEPVDQLHLTLMYLGEAADISPETQQAIVDGLRGLVEDAVRPDYEMPVMADGFAISAFNPGDNAQADGKQRDTCIVLGVSGDDLDTFHGMVKDAVDEVVSEPSGFTLPDQHAPWIPHVTLAFTDDLSMVEQLVDRVGRVVFDRVRVAFGGDNIDIPLAGVAADEVLVEAGDSDFADKHSDRDLREYWVHGKGAAKIDWPAKGSFERCVEQIRIHAPGVRDPKGLCAEYHHEATGKWPGEKRHHADDGDTAMSAPTMPADQPVDEPVVEEEMCPPGQHPDDTGKCVPDGPAAAAQVEHFHTWVTEGVSTGRRIFTPGAVTWREPPFAFHWQINSSAHGGRPVTVQVGLVTRVERDGDTVHFWGPIDLRSADGLEYGRRLAEGFARWSSVGPDESLKDADIELVWPEGATDGEPGEWLGEPDEEIYHKYPVAEVSAVSLPALANAMVEPTPALLEALTEIGVLVAAAVTTHSTGTSDSPWDKGVNEGRLPSPMSVATAKGVYAWIDDSKVDGGKIVKAGGSFPHHEVSTDGKPGAANLAACTTGIGALHGARSDPNIPDADRKGVYNHLAKHLRDGGQTPPDFGVVDPLVAAAHTITIPDVPPAEWFNEPVDVAPLGALTVTDEGRIYGYLAPANIAHRSFRDRRVMAPMDRVDYTRWMGGEAIVAGGGRVVAGPITMNCGHMPPTASTDPDTRMEHYDNTCSVVARAAIGENTHGVWVAGALMPGVDADQISRILACRLSGDWAPHPEKPGWREFVAALLVPVPGFPMARSGPSVRVVDEALVASAVPVQVVHATAAPPAPVAPDPNLRPVLERLARTIGRDASTQMAVLHNRVHAGEV